MFIFKQENNFLDKLPKSFEPLSQTREIFDIYQLSLLYFSQVYSMQTLSNIVLRRKFEELGVGRLARDI